MAIRRRASRAWIGLCLAAAASAAPSLARTAAAGEQPLVVLPCAPSSRGPLVFLGRRTLVESPNGAVGAGVPPFVPAWAGQWTPVAGSLEVTTTSTITLAARLFAAQTGQTIPGASAAIVQADQTDLEVVKVVVVPTTEAVLEQLVAAAEQAIATGAPSQHVLDEVAVVSGAEALERIGPVSPPPDGWAAWVVTNVYGGTTPGALDVTFPVLVAQLSARSVQLATPFRQALLGAGTACGGAGAP